MPDNWALSAFRRRHARGINNVFTQVLELARKLGLGHLGHVALDSTGCGERRREKGWTRKPGCGANGRDCGGRSDSGSKPVTLTIRMRTPGCRWR